MKLGFLNYRKVFTLVIVLSLIASALLGIFIFIFGNFETLQIKTLLTTLAVGVFSVLALINVNLLKKTLMFPFMALTTIVIAFICSNLFIWLFDSPGFFQTEVFYKTVLTFIILSISFSHISLLLLLDIKSIYSKYLLFPTFVFILGLASILIYIVDINKSYEIDSIYRAVGVFAILVVLCTILIPLLNRFTKH